MRRTFWSRAALVANNVAKVLNEGEEEAKRLSKKLESRGSYGEDGFKFKSKDRNPIKPGEYVDSTSVSSRKRVHRRSKLSTEEKLSIVHNYTIKHVPAAQIAKEFRISHQYVSFLVKKASKNPKVFDELKDVEE